MATYSGQHIKSSVLLLSYLVAQNTICEPEKQMYNSPTTELMVSQVKD